MELSLRELKNRPYSFSLQSERELLFSGASHIAPALPRYLCFSGVLRTKCRPVKVAILVQGGGALGQSRQNEAGQTGSAGPAGRTGEDNFLNPMR